MPPRSAARERPPDYYELLEVSPHASAEVIQAAYRALARTYHPDVNGAPAAAERMQQLNLAYQTLKDPRRRAAYNARRARLFAADLRRTGPRGRLGRRGSTTPRADAVGAAPQPVALRAPGVRVRIAVACAAVATLAIVIVAFSVWLAVELSDDTPTLPRSESAADFAMYPGWSTVSQPSMNGR